MDEQETYWEERYQSGDTPWEKGAPSHGLVDFLNQRARSLKKGTVCVPGCGMGHDVHEWARHGFHVTGIDIAPSSVARAAAEARKGDLNAHFITGDFLHRNPQTQFDWVFEHTFFCAIPPNSRSDYVKAMVRHVKPGGYLLAVHYLIPDEDGPPFGVMRSELIERFSPDFKILEEWVPRSYPNRTGLELMVWWRKK